LRAQLTTLSWCPFFICLLRWGPNPVTLLKVLWTCHTPHIEPLLPSHKLFPSSQHVLSWDSPLLGSAYRDVVIVSSSVLGRVTVSLTLDALWFSP
jgi:hypothetical protein